MKVIVVTGASAGIGRELVLQAADRYGAKIGLVARGKEDLEVVAAEARERGAAEALVMPCDVADRDAFTATLREVIDRLGLPDVMVNNAGFGNRGFIEDTPPEHIEQVFGVNVYALWHAASVLLRPMIERGSGQIITVSSIAGVIPFPGNAAYVAAKHAAVGFSDALRAELVGTGVEASVVLPGGVMTGWAENTVGGSLLPLFEYEGRRGAEIAEEEGIEPLELPDLLSPEVAAARILELIDHPQPVLTTHDRTAEVVALYHNDRPEFERRLAPAWRAHREGYRKG